MNIYDRAKDVNDLLALDNGLSSWEIQFLDSVSKQLDAKRPLSSKQHSIIDRLVEEKL